MDSRSLKADKTASALLSNAGRRNGCAAILAVPNSFARETLLLLTETIAIAASVSLT